MTTVFDGKLLAQLAKRHRKAFRGLWKVEDALVSRFHGEDMKDAIHAVVLAAATAQPLLLVGPPGTAKSLLIRAFCAQTGVLDEENLSTTNPDYFEYLLTPFTEPTELFGYYDIGRLFGQDSQAKGLFRAEDGMIRKAKVIYLDEVFNGSSAILNSLLTFMNERSFHDRGARKHAFWRCMFAATNNVPKDDPYLRAILDRFVLRCWVGNVSDMTGERLREPLRKMIERGWPYTYRTTPDKDADLLERQEAEDRSGPQVSAGRRRVVVSQAAEGSSLFTDLREFRVALSAHVNSAWHKRPSPAPLGPENDDEFFRHFAWVVEQLKRTGLSDMSNRRLVQALYVMVVHAIYRSVGNKSDAELERLQEVTIGENELGLLPVHFVDVFDIRMVEQMKTELALRYQSERKPGTGRPARRS